MSAILKIKGSELTPQLLALLRERYADRELEISLSKSKKISDFTEEKFWEIISLLDWKKEENEEIVQPVIDFLKNSPIKFIYQFQDFLSQKLYELDGKKYALHIGEDSWTKDNYFSADNFLYARCCVVANGKDYYYEVLNNPKKMPKDLTFEPILSIASKAYKQKTKEKFNYFPIHDYETYANQDAWM